MSSGLVVNRQFVKYVGPWFEPLRCTFFICVQKELIYTLSTDHKWTGNLIGWFGKACRTCGFEVRNLVGTIFLSVLFLTGGPPSVFLCEKNTEVLSEKRAGHTPCPHRRASCQAKTPRQRHGCIHMRFEPYLHVHAKL